MPPMLLPRLRIANLPAHWLFVPPLAFAALNNIALKSEAADGPLWKAATEEVSSVVVIFALVPLLIGLARRWPPALRPAVLMRHVGGMQTHDLQLRASEVVLRQLADAVEQERAELVVEPHRRKLARMFAHAFEHSVGECVSARWCVDRARMFCHG